MSDNEKVTCGLCLKKTDTYGFMGADSAGPMCPKCARIIQVSCLSIIVLLVGLGIWGSF